MLSAFRARDLSAEHAADVLDEMGILVDDRQPSFEDWLEGKLDGIAPGIAGETEKWLRTLRDGGPRARPRSIGTVWTYANTIRLILLDWSAHRGHLREVIRADVITTLESLHGPTRQATLVALRSLFGHCKNTRVVFTNPVSRIRVGDRGAKLIQPLGQDQIQRTVNDAARPADRLIIALAAVYAARSAATRALQLDDIDLGNRRLTIAAHVRPLDELTHRLLLEWLDYRRTRWPYTAHPHLLINNPPTSWGRSAGTGSPPGSADSTPPSNDRQLEEALTHGPDPLHLAVVFGLDEKTALRYATAARQLLETPIESTTLRVDTNPGTETPPRLNGPLGSQ